jgi:NADPH-dependent curcumin reductase CurA
MTISREIHLIGRPPSTLPVPGEVALVEVEVPSPEPGQVVVRNLYMAIDPGLLQRMQDVEAPAVPDYDLGGPMWGHALGEVVESASPSLRSGDLVLHNYAWREYAVADAADFQAVDADSYPSVTHHLSSAVVAYIGCQLIGIRPGDTVAVSSAAGAVGSIAGQLALVRGAGRVIASVGSSQKADFVTKTFGFHEAFDYHNGWPADLGGVDVYYDNVGGWQLDAAMDAMNVHGRIIICGATDELCAGETYKTRNSERILEKRLTVRGFTTNDHLDLFPAFEQEFPELVASGRVVLHETIIEGGIEQIIPAVQAQLRGAYLGKVLLRF